MVLHPIRWRVSTLLVVALAGGPATGVGRTVVHDPVEAVDPFIGTDGGGQVFVGAARPFAVVRLGPDVMPFDATVPYKAGYRTSGNILGFSHLHLSGAAGKYGNLLMMPVTGVVRPDAIRSPREQEVNSPGYYAATLTRYGVHAELTSSRRVGFHRYRFPAAAPAHLTLRLDHILTKGVGDEGQRFLGGEITRVSRSEWRGYGRYAGGWNNGGEYRVYFALVTDVPAVATRMWRGQEMQAVSAATVDHDMPFGVALDFAALPKGVLQAKLGVSFIGADQARRTIDRETPGWHFDGVRAQARAAWHRMLDRVRVAGGGASRRRQFYTALYHTMLMPSDRTGENPDWQSEEPYYDDFYTIWDTFRTSGPLLTLIAPERQRDMLRALIDIYRHAGYLPDGRSGNSNGRTQGGSNADVLITDAFVKGLNGIDYRTALAAMRKDAEVAPADDEKEGRGGLPDYLEKGYVSLAYPRSGSRTVEYAYDDYAIARLACGLGQIDAARAAASRAGNWRNLWDRDSAVQGVHGFLRPRNPDGSWAAADFARGGEWSSFLYEADTWTYSLYVPHDGRGLVALAGGAAAFVRRLDTLFDRGHFDMSNEPGFLIPMLYHWAGRPDRSADRIAELLESRFGDSRAGLPGPDDSGAMSSWFAFQALGIFPVAGQDVYLIGTPGFAEATLMLGGGRSLRIVARNFDPRGLNRYVVAATLNGRPLTRAWFRHRDIAAGGVLALTMASAPTDWGRDTRPPSQSDPSSPQLATCAPAAVAR
jgi:predicted alpha-1,2-mannosidase